MPRASGALIEMLTSIIQTKDEARNIAIEWQYQQANKDMFYSDLIDTQNFFSGLASKFDLKEEFIENGIPC